MLKITGEASTSLHMPSPSSSLHFINVITADILRYTTIIPYDWFRAWKGDKDLGPLDFRKSTEGRWIGDGRDQSAPTDVKIILLDANIM